VAALGKLGFRQIRLVNRTLSRSEGLIRALAPLGLDITPVDWTTRNAVLDAASLLVNTTSLGMLGEPPLDLDLGALPADAVVTDIVYAPLETPLLAAARARALCAVDGLGMLLHQARPGFHAWFGRDPEVTPALRAHVLG
jgi:shikimate dehydrogenase